MQVVELLQRLGFSEYEARAYVALLQRNPMNGYAIAKASGIPRANVYGVLQKLEERSAVIRVENVDGTDYVPVRPDAFIQRLSSEFEGTAASALELLESLGSPTEIDYVENLQGQGALVQHAQDVMQQAQHEILIAVWRPEAHLFSGAITDAAKRGIQIRTLCFQACPHDCGDCRGQIYSYSMGSNRVSRAVIVIADNREMLFGTVYPQQTIANRTRQQQLIEMASWYIRHSIAAAALVDDLGNNLETIISPETRTVLQTVGPGFGWIDSVRALLSRNPQEDH